ncbi:hypothetical protein B0T18DRAFT_429914 [Schizothecium vesticola]|uniref:Uncharacterized protein n=1 Tax=Schizothecium vesticola TaxID=314040 RepID=A0AA40EXA1_9PEZI|nr:hypothetical protein B0T18DRAFT_429914 [Schizothecium vesticola]
MTDTTSEKRKRSAIKTEPDVESAIETEPDVNVDSESETEPSGKPAHEKQDVEKPDEQVEMVKQSTSASPPPEKEEEDKQGCSSEQDNPSPPVEAPRHTRRDEGIATRKKSPRVDTTNGIDISAVSLKPHGAHSPPPSAVTDARPSVRSTHSPFRTNTRAPSRATRTTRRRRGTHRTPPVPGAAPPRAAARPAHAARPALAARHAPARAPPADLEDVKRGTDNRFIEMYKELKKPYINSDAQRRGLEQMAPENKRLLCFGIDGIIYKWYPQEGGSRKEVAIAVRNGGLSEDVK